MTEADHITVSELIAHVKGQLQLASQQSNQAGGDKLLELQECTLSLEYEVTKTAGGGIDLKVVSGDAARERRMGNSIEIKLKPVGAADSHTYVVTEGNDDDKPVLGRR